MNPSRPSLVRVEAFCNAPCVHMIKKPGLYQITMVTRCVSKIWSSWGHSGTLAFYVSHRNDRCNVGPSRPVSVGFIMFISITVGSRVDIYKWIGWKSTCIHGAKHCTHWSGEIRIVPKSCEFVGHLVAACPDMGFHDTNSSMKSGRKSAHQTWNSGDKYQRTAGLFGLVSRQLKAFSMFLRSFQVFSWFCIRIIMDYL